jgi:hypothetical protein
MPKMLYWVWSATMFRYGVAFNRFSIGIKGPNVCQENIPHTSTPSPNPDCHQHDGTGTGNRRTRQCFSTPQLSSVGDGLPTGATSSCLYLLEVEPSVVVCCNSPSVTKVGEFCVLRCRSAHHCCTAPLFAVCGLPVSLHNSCHSPSTSLINELFSPT